MLCYLFGIWCLTSHPVGWGPDQKAMATVTGFPRIEMLRNDDGVWYCGYKNKLWAAHVEITDGKTDIACDFKDEPH